MSKELAFTDDNDVVKYLDTTTAFNLALTADGVAFDLTNAKSILVKIANDDGYIMQQTIDLTTVSSPLGGTLIFPINQDIMNTLVPDDYDIEVWVTMNDGTQAIFPSDGTLGFSIEDNLMSDTGEVIPTITLNDFQQQFNDLSNQMENAVHNVQKGDQGNPGNGIKSANNQYQLSNSPVTVPTGGWSDTILATTDQLPYLWTKIIFSYDDGTTKETNFVSSRGDTGSQGPIGPVGPQGEQGNGLVVRGKADKEENLPTTGNNQGDGYLVGTDLYIWIDGSWQNMGSITPDLADYAKVADMNNALGTKANTEDVNQQLDKKLNTADTTNWQKQKITNDDGTALLSIGDSDDLSAKLSSLSTGFFTFYFSANCANNPSTKAGRGFIEMTYADATNGSDGNGILFDEDNVIFVVTILNSKVSYFRLASLSGANNFDTVPTVNNNPLLLASSLPADLARTGQDTNFTRKLQKSGIDVATTDDVSNAINTAVSPLNTNTNWTSLNVDSSQVENTDWEPTTTSFQYRIYHNTLYLTGYYIMLGVGSDKTHNSSVLFQLPTDLTSKISFPSTNEFTIGILQALAQQASMFTVNLTNNGKITCVTNPYDLSTTYGASMAGGFINAAIPLNL